MDGALILFLLLGLTGGLLVGLGVGWFFGKRSAPPPGVAEVGAVPPEAKTSPPSLGVMLRRREDGLEVTLDGVAYRRYATMPADSRRRLVAYLRLVGAWMEGKPTREIVTAATPQRKPQPDAPPSVDAAGGGSASASQRMIEQIDEIVQHLQAEADLPEPVRVVSGATGGVNILVGLKRYEYIEHIPDEAVQALVRRAVQIWESRQ